VNEREKKEGESRKDAPSLEFPDDFTVVVKVPKAKPAIYQFDRVFYSPATTQKEVYDLAARDTIEDVLSGYNGTIFAYGQTGAGKSFSMSGADVTHPETKGIIPRSCDHIFQHIASDVVGTEYTLKCSFLEIYKEIVHDLLDPESPGNLKVRETPSRGVWVQGLSEHFVTSVEDIIDLLQTGEKSRAVSATNMNAVSSRSHSLFILTLIQRNPDGSTKEGKLNLADLAGSEKVGKTGASGDTLEEAKKINQSLSALGNCINALTKAKRGHVPYRDSKLTHILRESLGGNSKTTLLIACSPHVFNVEETISTLKFGQRAKTIKNNVHVNQQRSVKELEAIIDNLTRELAYLKLYSEHLERDLLKLDPAYDLAALRKRLAAQQAEKQAQAEAAARAENSYIDDESTDTATTTSTDNDDDELSQTSAGEISSNLDGVSTPAKLASGSTSSRRSETPSVPSPTVHFDASYDPMALAEAQLQIQQMRERYELRMMDLKDEVSRLTSENRESEESLDQAKAYVAQSQKEIELVKAELAREREEAALRNAAIDYETKRRALEVETQVAQLSEAKVSLEQEVTKWKETSIKANTEAEIAKDEKESLDKKLKAALADAQRWKLRVDSGAADAAKKDAVLQKRRADEAEARNKVQEKELQALRAEVEASRRQIGEGQIELEKAAKERTILERSLSQLGVAGASGTSASGMPDEIPVSKAGNAHLSQPMLNEAMNVAASAAAAAAVGEMADQQRRALELTAALQRKEMELKEVRANLEAQQQVTQQVQQALGALQEVVASNEADMQERAKQRDSLVRETEEALALEKESREKAELEVRALKRALAAQETKLVSTSDLLERTQRETQQAALNMTRQMDQASARVKELEATIETMHERQATLQSQLDDAVEKFARMSAEFSDQLKTEQQENMQLRNTMSRTHRAGVTAPGARRAPSNMPRQIKGGQGAGHPQTPATPEPAGRGFVDWLFGRDPLPTQGQLDGAQKRGILWKQSGLFKSWRQQYFVLKGHKLYYYTSKDSKAVAEGVYQIDGCSPNTKRDVEPDSSYRYQFTVSHPSRKTLYLCAQSSADMASWIEVIDELATCTRAEAETRVFQSAAGGAADASMLPEPESGGVAASPAATNANVTDPRTPTASPSAAPSGTPNGQQGTPYKAPRQSTSSVKISVSAPKTPAPSPVPKS
jgi:kinesin family protein 5